MKKYIKRFIKNILLKRKGIIADINSDIWIANQTIINPKHPITVTESSVNAIAIGEGCRFFKCACYGNINFGRFTSVFGGGTVLSSILSTIKVGSFCSIGQNVNIQDSNHRIDKISSYFMGRNIFEMAIKHDVSTKGSVLIEDDVWIGANSVILSGVTIGRGSIIGAGSVVTKNIPPYSIAFGTPAKIIKQRFKDETIEYLENLKWWEWSIEKLNMNKDLFFLNINKEDKANIIIYGGDYEGKKSEHIL
jgi:virginiamycin A acetyltransferase